MAKTKTCHDSTVFPFYEKEDFTLNISMIKDSPINCPMTTQHYIDPGVTARIKQGGGLSSACGGEGK